MLNVLRRCAAVGLVTLTTVFLAGRAGAATFTWTGGDGATGNWSSASNWTAPGAPTSAGTTDLVFANNTSGQISSNNIANPFIMNSMTFNSGLPALSVTGSTLTFNGGSAKEIFQSSANPVSLGQSLYWGQSAWLYISGSGTGDLTIGTLAFNDQGFSRVRNTAAFNVILPNVSVPGPRTADINNDMPAATGKQITIGSVSFTTVGATPVFELFGVGKTEITGQLIPVTGAAGSVNFNPSTNGTVLLSNAAGAFVGTVDGTFGSAGGTINLGGATHQIRDLTFYGANATTGTVAVRNFYLDYGTVNVAMTDGAGYAGNLIKRDITNGDSSINTAFSHTGVTRLIASDITLQNNGTANQSSIEFDVVPQNGEDSRLILSNTAANNANRINDTKSVTLNGGQLLLVGNASAATQEDMGPVTVSRQAALIIGAAAGGVASLTGDSLTRSNYGTLFVGGNSLGAVAAANVGQVKFDTAPAMTTGTLGTTSAPLVPWVAGTPGDWTGYSSGNWYGDMLTYEAGRGFRTLAASEYVLNSPATGGGANNRLAINTTTTWNLTGANVSMKSLAIVPAGNGTYTLGGIASETLTITDGVIVSGRSNQAPVNVISVANLTFGPNSVTGYEGIIHAYNGATTTINSNIINNGANAVSLTKAGPGTVTLKGTNVIGSTLRINEGSITVDGNSSTTVSNVIIDSVMNGSLDVITGSSVTTTGTGTVLYVKRPLNQAATSGGGTINLSGDVYVTNAAASIQGSQTTFGANMNLGAATRTFTVDNGISDPDLIVSGAIGGTGGLTKVGAGQMRLTGTNGYSGATTVSASSLSLYGASGTAVPSASVTADWGTGLTLDSSGGNNSNRLGNSAPVTLRGSELRILGNSTASTPTQEDSGAITLNGQTTITLDAAGGGVTSLTADNFSRALGGNAMLRGDSLGSAAAANVGQMFLSTAPTLVGAGALGSTSAPILPFLFGDTNIAATGSRESGCLVTYDTNGFRLLSRTTEMTGTLAAGVNWFSTGGNLTSTTAINSLFVQHSASITGNAGTTLTITSGAIMHASGYDPLTISVPQLTFGNNPVTGYEGIVYVNRVGNGTTTISSAIVDNGGNAVALTKAGGGFLALSGATDNTYSGPTTVTAGTLYVNKNHAGAGAFTVLYGATLGGTGTINAPVTVQVGGTLNPGASVGTLTMNSQPVTLNGTLLIELSGATTDWLKNVGNLTLGANSALTFSFTDAFLPGQFYAFANYTSRSGTFGTITGMPSNRYIDYNYLGGNQIALVPEPGACLLLGLAAAAALRRRVRRG